MLRVRILSCGCTREAWKAREKRKGYSRRIREQLLLLLVMLMKFRPNRGIINTIIKWQGHLCKFALI